MEKEIYLPKDLTEFSSMDFVRRLEKISYERYKSIKIIVSNFAKENGRIEPFGALVVINALENLFSICESKGLKWTIEYTKDKYIRNTYAKTMRFYSSLGIPIGQSPDKDYEGSSQKNFIPIMKCSVQAIKSAHYEFTTIKQIASKIAIVASRGNQILFNYIEYCIIEILRNVVDHSESKHFWYAAQTWTSDFGGKTVEIAMMDQGIGIHESLKEELDEKDIGNALRFAMIPGCSSKPTTHYIEEADNSGFGLFMISEICKDTGNIVLASNNDYIKLSADEEVQSKTYLSGTIIRLRFNLDKLTEYQTQLSELVDKGMEIKDKYIAYRERIKFAPGLPLPILF